MTLPNGKTRHKLKLFAIVAVIVAVVVAVSIFILFAWLPIDLL